MPKNKKQLAKVMLVRRIMKELRKRKPEMYIRSIFRNRWSSGESILVGELRDDPLYHHKYFRMNKENFDEILSRVQPLLRSPPNHLRPISVTEKLAVTLRFLATGCSQIQLAMNYRISPSSVCRILRQTMLAICKTMESEYLPSPTEETWKSAEQGFRTAWNFPNCCGAIDGKLVRIRAPSLTGSLHYNYKGFFSLVLLAIADANYKFLAVDIGACGSMSDGGVLSRSAIGERLQNDTLGLPPAACVTGSTLLPHVIVGDDAFPLRPNLMKPYSGKEITPDRRIYNYRLSRARMVVENSFGILAARWRILHTSITGEVDFIELIIKTCVILHNFLMSKKDLNSMSTDTFQNGTIIEGNWRQSDTCLESFGQQGSNNFSNSAADVREKFKNFLNTTGQVSWQANMI